MSDKICSPLPSKRAFPDDFAHSRFERLTHAVALFVADRLKLAVQAFGKPGTSVYAIAVGIFFECVVHGEVSIVGTKGPCQGIF